MDFTHFYPWFIYVFRVFYMHFGIFLEYLQVQVPIRIKWWFCGILEPLWKHCWKYEDGVDYWRKILIDGSLSTSIDGEPSAKFTDDLRKLRILPRSSKICTMSHWPLVRLFNRIFYVLPRYRLLERGYFWRQTSLHLEKRA